MKRLFFCSIGLIALASVLPLSTAEKANSKPVLADAPCRAPDTWFPSISESTVAALGQTKPAVDDECSFYKFAYGNFLWAVQENDGKPRFLGFDTYASLFHEPLSPMSAKEMHGRLSLAPRLEKQVGGPNGFEGIEQAQVIFGVLIDQTNQPVYYSMHFNSVYSQFLKANGLFDRTKLKSIGDTNPDLVFNTGAVEYKAAWRLKPDGVGDKEFRAQYVTVSATVPSLVKSNDPHHPIKIDPDHPVQKTVGLIALHVVGVLEGHPEFVWATFEHQQNAPLGKGLDQVASGDPVDNSSTNWLLYKKGTSYRSSNPSPGSFTYTLRQDGSVAPATSIYRVFPPGGGDATATGDDPQVADLTDSVQSQLPQNSALRNYKLVGAVWLNQPEKVFVSDQAFSDDQLLGGEKQLSSTAMESFTQINFPHCFSCHDTQQQKLMSPSKLNVSHALTKFANSDGK